MDNVKELLFLHEADRPCHLAALAASFKIKATVFYQVSEIIEYANKHDGLCLIPQKGMPLDKDGIPQVANKLINELPIAIYQAERNTISESAAIVLGVQGLLYSDISIELVMTSLQKMIDGELWFDRQSLSDTVKNLIKTAEPFIGIEKVKGDSTILDTLTTREKTIIHLVSSGARNKEIADKLSISEHTVKAHISSIFRKTHARNRVELLRWSSHHESQFVS